MNVRRTALLPLPAAHLYDIIEAAEHYPRFLPWCAGARIVHRDDEMVSADLQVKWGGMNFEMRTRNPKRRPEFMAIHLERGPFKRFEGEWHVTPLAPDACKVLFTLDWEFDSGLMTRVAGPVFKKLTDTMVEAFIQHALVTPVTAAPVATPSPIVCAAESSGPAPDSPPLAWPTGQAPESAPEATPEAAFEPSAAPVAESVPALAAAPAPGAATESPSLDAASEAPATAAPSATEPPPAAVGP